MIESKTRDIRPWTPVDDPAGKAVVKHAKDALKQLLKDFTPFKGMFPDISAILTAKIRYNWPF